jgi:hypothetical protein
MFNVGFLMLNERNRRPKAVDWSLQRSTDTGGRDV